MWPLVWSTTAERAATTAIGACRPVQRRRAGSRRGDGECRHGLRVERAILTVLPEYVRPNRWRKPLCKREAGEGRAAQGARICKWWKDGALNIEWIDHDSRESVVGDFIQVDCLQRLAEFAERVDKLERSAATPSHYLQREAG